MNAVFADTFYWIAITNVQDLAHEKAKAFALQTTQGALCTTQEECAGKSDGSNRLANGRFVFSRLESLPRESGQGLQPDGLHFDGDDASRGHHRGAYE